MVCVVKLEQMFYSGSEFSLAHAQRIFVSVVLHVYLKIISSPTLQSVKSFMLVPVIAQALLLAA